MKLNKGIACALALALMTSAALADTTTNNSTTTATVQEAAPSLMQKVTMSYLGLVYGPSVGNPNGFTPDEYGRFQDEKGAPANGKVNMENYLMIGYKATPTLTPTLVIGSVYNMVAGQDLRMTDPYLKVGGKLVDAGKFSLTQDIRGYIPVSTNSRNSGLITALASYQVMNYQLTEKFSLSNAFYLRYFLRDGSAAVGKRVGDAMVLPSLNYQISAPLSASLGYEADAMTNKGDGVTDWSRNGTYVYTGIAWDITPSINFNPFLQFMPGGKVNADSTTLNAYLSAKIL